MKIKSIITSGAVLAAVSFAFANDNVIEEVAWTIGDDPIYKSEIEQTYRDLLDERVPIKGDPYCVIPEMIAVQRLYLHQADLDTIEVPESQIAAQVDAQLNFIIGQLGGSTEKVEQYFRKPMSEIREYYMENTRNRARVNQVQKSLTAEVKSTPSDVRKYFNSLPEDSIPHVPLQVEVQIITINPSIPRQEIDDIKARLRDYAERVNSGQSDFSTLAILYSEDKGSSSRGGELGFRGRSEFVPEFAAVAFNLTDPKKVSKIVETEYGYHIIQMIEKRGDRMNARHILLRPKVSEKDLLDASVRLDSLRSDIVDKKLGTFEEAALQVSQDKSTRNSRGIMVNDRNGTTRFEMQDLPQEISRVVATMQPGDISQPIMMKDPKRDRDIVALVKLSRRIDAHKANLGDDFQLIKDMYEESARQAILDKWLDKKISDTYVRIEDGWRGCDFERKGWIKTGESN